MTGRDVFVLEGGALATPADAGRLDSPASRPPRPLRAARAAVSALFFLNGAGMANWVVRIPAVQDRLGLGEGALGLALLGVAVGALIAMPLAGRVVARRGSRPVSRVSAVAFACALALPALATSLTTLTLVLFVLGAANGVLDVAMNSQAATVERRYGRPIMASFHALFSLGGLAGAAIGGLAAARGIAPMPHLTVVALAAVVASFAATRGMLPANADAAPGSPSFARPTRVLLMLGVIAFCVLFGEGAMADWSAVYLRKIVGAGPGLAAAGYAAFSLAMAAGRSVGDALTIRFGPARLVRAGGAVAALGLSCALLIAQPWAAIIGFGAVGAGLATVFPTLLATAGRLPGQSSGTAIAAVSTFGYTGFLAGPPIIGFAAEALTIRGGLAVVVIASLLIVILAGALRAATGPDANSSTRKALMSTHPAIRVRLQGLAGALRFAWLPTVCALVVAMASEHPRGRMLAITLAALSIVFGAVVHRREILFGRPLTSGATPRYGEDEWMKAVR